MDEIVSKVGAASILGLSYEDFILYDSSDLLDYRLIKGRRWYHVDELTRFKKEVLDMHGNFLVDGVGMGTCIYW